jgi:dTDP-4-amino-4,6-dideoxygalactose transaminase
VATAPCRAEAPAAAAAVPLTNVRAAARLADAGLRAAFDRVLCSGRYTLNATAGACCEVAAFEAEWAAFCGAAHCTAVGSGAAALQLMLLAAGIGPSDEGGWAAGRLCTHQQGCSQSNARPTGGAPQAGVLPAGTSPRLLCCKPLDLQAAVRKAAQRGPPAPPRRRQQPLRSTALISLWDPSDSPTVIVASNSYPATVFAIIHVGACAVLVEPDPATRNLSATGAAAAFTPRTRAVLATDMYGAPIDYAGLSKVAHARGAWLFTDASHAHGAESGGRPAGGLADAAAYSFYPTKNLGAIGEAGAVVTNCAAFAARARALRDYGRAPAGETLPPAPSPPRPRAQQPQQLPQQALQPQHQPHFQHQPPQFQAVGFNERMDPLQAAFLCAKLPHLPAQLAARRRIAARYLDALRGLPWLVLPQVAADTAPAWHLFVVECDTSARRDAMRTHLAARGVEAAVHYPTPPHLTPALRGHPLVRAAGADSGRGGGGATVFCLPVAEGLAGRVLSLPVCPSLSKGQVGRVIDAVLDFGGRSKL